MATLSRRVGGIFESGRDGWEVHYAGIARKRAGEDIIMCSIGDHDFPTPDISVEAAVKALRDGHHHYTDLAGKMELRDAMAEVSTRATGVVTRRENVIATAGGQGALFAAIAVALDPGEHLIVVSPYYATYPGTCRANSVEHTVVDAPADNGFEPVRPALEAAVRSNTKAILINSPNNPTGAVYSRQTIEMLASFCIDHDLWLISDEVYWPFTSAEHPHISPVALPGMEERTLVLNSVSKSHAMTGWRVGWLRGPADLVAKLVALNIVTTYGLADFVSVAVAQALRNDWGVDDIRALYDRRRKHMLEQLRGANGVRIRASDGGMYVMLDVTSVSASGEEFAFSLLKHENVTVMPGESFGHSAAGHIRMAMTQDEAILAEAAKRVRRHVENLLSGKIALKEAQVA